MVSVNAASATTGVTTTSSDNPMADFDTFLQLLTAQLANQDPLNPTDGTEFTAQLAQFSSLEQQINTNELLKQMINSQPDTQQAEAMSYIGKEILVPGDSFMLGETGNVEFNYDVDTKLESAKAVVYNSAGEKVHEFTVQTNEGIHEILWDGKDAEGNRLPSDVYSIKVEGQQIQADGSSKVKPLTTYFYSEAVKVTKLGASYAVMTADGRAVELDDILAARKIDGSGDSDGSKHATALQMLGKEILIPGSDFVYAGQDLNFTYGLSQDVKSVKVTITDEKGNKIKEVPFEASEGSHEFTWDGTDADGNKVEPGNYKIEVTASDTDAEGEVLEEKLDTFYYGEATKVEAVDGIVLIYTDDGRKAFYEEVISTREKN
jgi:flagellar basal-body rod modification protein FlgD